MRRHLAYLKYVLRHKWFVLVAGLKIGAPLRRLILHDMSKFLPEEWIPYAKTFYAADGSSQYEEHKDFDNAWFWHIKRNLHHWQYWLLNKDDGSTIPMKMWDEYILEMVADWMGAGRAITGKWEFADWYKENYDTIQLEDSTRSKVDSIIRDVRDSF